MGYVFDPAQFLANAHIQLQHAMASLERVSVLLDIVPEDNIGVGKTIKRLKGGLEFKDVYFSYDNKDQVLKDISFNIKPGEKVAIVGPSGVGKTTLLSLLLRFYKPNKGEIYFDNLPAADYELDSLRCCIGYVSQSTLLLSGTILENLRYGNLDASKDQVFRAAKTAGIHEFIKSLPEKYDTVIGERGTNLSEGQKQRISIARALIRNPSILVFDEPTSALDSATERSIFDSLPANVKGKTLLVVAHRISTVKNSDRIILLNENRLIATGTHRSLLETNDYYRFLVNLQQNSPEKSP
ncbi:ABC transporter ATP-binding protein [Acidobacteriota bacterium]